MSQKPESSHPLLWFIALAVTIGLVAFIFSKGFHEGIQVATTTPPRPVNPNAVQAGPDIRQLRLSSMEAVAHGKQLFASNCASCHGPEGYGDGPKSKELNPGPRNYHTDKFKNGNAPLQIAKTLQTGLGGMPAFPLMPIEDRFALVHFVRTLVPTPANDDSVAVNALPASGTKAALPSSTVAQDTTPRIPIRYAIKLLAEENRANTVGKKTIFPAWMKQPNVNAH